MSNSELGAFLRARREALGPAEVGLPSGPRRRTPGLRRSELATLAGVSVEYLTRLEQGRDRHPSTEVLSALARALRLDFDTEVRLRMLSKTTDGPACTEVPPPGRIVRPSVAALLDRLESTPAVVLNRVSDLLAHTTPFGRLAEPTGLLGAAEPNLTRYVFTHPNARTTFPDWAAVADKQAAALREHAPWDGRYTADLATELRADPEFNRRWAGAPSLPASTGVERWVHPEVGELRLTYETLDLRGGDQQRLVVYLPADESTGTRLDQLAGRQPGALRAVTA